ncbi:MAG: DUF2797 domain-containing protein [Pseudomonadales bacterium]
MTAPVQAQGTLAKLRWDFEQKPSDRYQPEPVLLVGETAINLRSRIGQRMRFTYAGKIHCCHCGRISKRSFSQGYCYPCFKKLARCDLCIMSPTRCHFDAGTCREPEWAQGFCFAPHSVYLANSSGLKVGITGSGREPTRWVDQGAAQALVLLHCATRQLAGTLEAALAEHISDRTHWRKLLSGDAPALDLPDLADQALKRLGALPEGAQAVIPRPIEINYPISRYGPVKTINLEKSPLFESTLLGVKGQYLLFEDGVLNVRRHTAFAVSYASGPGDDAPESEQMEIF